MRLLQMTVRQQCEQRPSLFFARGLVRAGWRGSASSLLVYLGALSTSPTSIVRTSFRCFGLVPKTVSELATGRYLPNPRRSLPLSIYWGRVAYGSTFLSDFYGRYRFCAPVMVVFHLSHGPCAEYCQLDSPVRLTPLSLPLVWRLWASGLRPRPCIPRTYLRALVLC